MGGWVRSRACDVDRGGRKVLYAMHRDMWLAVRTRSESAIHGVVNQPYVAQIDCDSVALWRRQGNQEGIIQL